MNVRRGTLADAPALAGLMTQLGYPVTSEQMRERLLHVVARADFATFLGEVDGRVVAMAGLCLTPSYERDGTIARLTAFVVDEAHRGEGLGARLLEVVERWAASMGAVSIVVTSATHRGEAHAFYNRRGYATTGLRFGKSLSPP